MKQRQGAVAQGFGVPSKAHKAVGLKPQRRGGELDGVFEIAALDLEMVRPQVHAFGPNHAGKLLHGALPLMVEVTPHGWRKASAVVVALNRWRTGAMINERGAHGLLPEIRIIGSVEG